MALEQPKKPVGGAFGQFVAEKRPEFTKQCVGQKASAISKLAGEEWKKVSEAEKAKYQNMFEEAKKKFDVDMAAFLEAGGEKSKGAAAQRNERRKEKEGKLKAKADPNKPKKPAGGAYGCFMNDRRAEFLKEAGGNIAASAKLASATWKEMSAGDKQKYEEQYQKKKAEYEKAMESYVPPARAAADDGDAEDKKDASSPPAKKARVSKEGGAAAPKAAVGRGAGGGRGRGRGRGAAKAEESKVDIPQAVLAQAQKSGMADVLTKLVGRPEIQARGVSAKDALAALEQSNGLLHPARSMLLGGA